MPDPKFSIGDRIAAVIHGRTLVAHITDTPDDFGAWEVETADGEKARVRAYQMAPAPLEESVRATLIAERLADVAYGAQEGSITPMDALAAACASYREPRGDYKGGTWMTDQAHHVVASLADAGFRIVTAEPAVETGPVEWLDASLNPGSVPATAPSVCGATVGPVPKLDGERFICALASGHDGDHEAIDGTWFVDSIARYPAPSVEQIATAIAVVEGDFAGRWQVAAEAIRALYGSGDAGEPEWYTDTESGKRTLHFEGAEWVEASEAENLNRVISLAQANTDRAIAAMGRLEDKVERCEAALEAAEAQNRAERNAVAARLAEESARTDLTRAAEEYAESKRELFAARAAAARARAAVEAETSEEAGA